MVRKTQTRVANTVDSRAYYDWGPFSIWKRWSQVDTGADAPWFGQWAHVFERKVATYAEGDLTIIECDTDEEFVAELEKVADFARRNNRWKSIDTYWDDVTRGFMTAGASHLVHQSSVDNLDDGTPERKVENSRVAQALETV